MRTEASTGMWAEASTELKLCSRPRLAATYARLGSTRQELQCELRLATTCAGLGATYQEIQGTTRLAAARSGLWTFERFGESSQHEPRQVVLHCRGATGRGLGLVGLLSGVES